MIKRFLLCICVTFAYANFGNGKATSLLMNDGRQIPVLGLGTALNGSSSERVQAGVEAAIDFGYRHIDTAARYNTEELVGRGIHNKILGGAVTREDLFIVTKLWGVKHVENEVVPTLRDSLKRLQLDYVDLYLIHWPIGLNADGTTNDIDYLETWRGMEEAEKLGLTKSIGVSNFNTTQLERVIKNSKVKPAVNQIEVNPNLTQKKMLAFCKQNDIVVTAFTPLGSMPDRRFEDINDAPAPRIDDPKLLEMAERYNKTTVQIVLRYLVDLGLVAIPKSVTPSRIEQNIDIFDFRLSEDEIKTIDAFNKDFRLVAKNIWKENIHYPFVMTE